MPAVEPAEPQLPPFDHTPAPYQGPSKEEVHALRKQYLSPGERRLVAEHCNLCCAASCRFQIFRSDVSTRACCSFYGKLRYH